MCVVNHYFEDQDPHEEPLARPCPRLVWVIPVDIVKLAENLEAIFDADQQVTTLRLSHRFGGGSLSKLPQEILEVIVDKIQQPEIRTRSQWDRGHACFQGTCSAGQHFLPHKAATELMWNAHFGGLDRAQFTDEQKACLVEHQIDREGYYSDDFDSEFDFDVHHEIWPEWADTVCLCDRSDRPQSEKKFARMNKFLKSRYGLEIYVLHEILSSDMDNILPGYRRGSICHYTSAFLTLAPSARAVKGIKASRKNPLFVPNGSHFATRQTINPAKLSLSDNQRQCFITAMRALRLSPEFHLTQLESMVAGKKPASFWKACDRELAGEEAGPECNIHKFQRFLRFKSRELAKQSWPQLQLLAASDAVDPIG